MAFPLAAIGLGLQGAGLLGQLFGKSEEDKRYEQERRNQEAISRTLAFLAEQRQKRLSEGVTKIGRQSQSLVANARSAAAQRAAAAGRSGETESYVLPAEGRAASAGNEVLSRFVEGTNQFYDRASVNAQMAGLDQSLQPLPEQGNWTDYALPVGAAMTKYGLLSNAVNPNDTSVDATGGLPLTSPAKPDISAPEPLSENAAMDIQPETPFRMNLGQSAEKSFDVKPEDVRFGFNDSGLNPRLNAYRGLRRGSVFGY